MSDQYASNEFYCISGNDYLEDTGFTADIDLNNVPTCSQEALQEILGKEEPEPVEGPLEEVDFATKLNELVTWEDDEMLEHFIDVACDYPMKKEALTDETLNFISNPKHEKSRKLYERYQK